MNPRNGSRARCSSKLDEQVASWHFSDLRKLSMQHFWSLNNVNLHNTWLTIGSFDGVHLGHQFIVRQLTEGAHAEGAKAVVLTFHPHPAVVLGKREKALYLTSPEERANLLGELGVDVVITHPFNLEISKTSARDFISQIKARLGLRHLMIGHDFALGRDREGDAEALRRLGAEFDYSLEVISPLTTREVIVSSSKIRSALEAGEVAEAARLLGRAYHVSGEVVHGEGRGRTIGIPTANLEIWEERMLPKAGVYVCKARIMEKTWGAVTNIGVRPTFETDDPQPTVEAHLLKFEGELYGYELHLDFISRLRDEKRFASVDELVAQIQTDIQNAEVALS